MKYVRTLVMTLLAVLTFSACSEDDLNSTSIFPTGNSTSSNFDQWLNKNYTEPYNIKVLYRYNDLETDNFYNVVPADTVNAKALAIAIKHIWLGAYDEVAGPDFLKQFSPRVFQFLGSPEFNSQGEIVLGTAEGGVKITLFNVNALQPDNPYIDQESAFPNHQSEPMDMNYWFFHTMHHEFCHILTQTKDYSTEFRSVSAGKYQTTNWINVDDPDAPAMGFVTGYGSSEYNEDFAEIYSSYITKTPEAWEKILEAGMTAQLTSTGDTVYVKDADGNYVYLTDADGNRLPVYDANGSLVPVTDGNGNVVYAKDSQGNDIYYKVDGEFVAQDKLHTNLYYAYDDDGNLDIYFIYQGKLYPVTVGSGNPIYMTDAQGDTLYNKAGEPMPVYYRVPQFEYRKQVSYDTAGRDAIETKLAIMKEYFKNSWNIDMDKLRDVVLRRANDIKTLDLKNLK